MILFDTIGRVSVEWGFKSNVQPKLATPQFLDSDGVETVSCKILHVNFFYISTHKGGFC